MAETTETILVKVEWGSRSSKGKWGYRAIAAMKAAGAVYDPDRKVWALPADAELSQTTWSNLQVVG
jgi:hypothetical protein